MLTIEEFCKEHDACIEGREWALANCKDMAEVWDTAKPDWLIWVLGAASFDCVIDDAARRKAACWCARNTPLADGRTAWDLLADDRARQALEVAERYAAGLATDVELGAAYRDVCTVARQYPADSACGWAIDAVVAAAGPSSWPLPYSSVRSATIAAATVAVLAADPLAAECARETACTAAHTAQAAAIRRMIPNPFRNARDLTIDGTGAA